MAATAASSEGPVAPGATEHFFLFALPENRTATLAQGSAGNLLHYLLSKAPAAAAGTPAPEVVFAAAVGLETPSAGKVTLPDSNAAWDVAVVLRLPPGAGVRPGDVGGGGLTTKAFHMEVRPRPLPSAQDCAACADGPVLNAAIEKQAGAMQDLLNQLPQLKAFLQNATNQGELATEVSGLTLLKCNAGDYGEPCFFRYLAGAYGLFTKYGGGVAYFGEVVKDPAVPEDQQWDVLVVPTYNTLDVIIQVARDPGYPKILAYRDVALAQVFDYWVNTLQGSHIAFPGSISPGKS